MASNKDAELVTQLLTSVDEGPTPPPSEPTPPKLPLQEQGSWSSHPADPTRRPRLPPPRLGELITVLSIDGGGIRGLIPAVVLKSLEEKLQDIDRDDPDRKNENARIADYFDVIAGTSTGGLIAAMLVTPNDNGRPKYTPQEIQDFYIENGPKIFPPKSGLLARAKAMVGAFFGPKYKGTFLHDKIKQLTGNHTLADTMSKLVLLTFDVGRLEPVIFSSFEDAMQKSHGETKPFVSDVCIGTSAAPTFFPAHHFDVFRTNGTRVSEFHLIDGGVAANNPTMAAITRVTREQLLKNTNFHPDGVDYKKYLVISIGTGSGVKAKGLYTAEDCAKWSPINWLYNWSNSHSPIMDIFSQATALLVDWHVRMLLHNPHKTDQEQNYLRIEAQDPLFGVDMLAMDDATGENMKSLVEVGKNLVTSNVARVNLTTGRYQVDDEQENAWTNDQELERFAKSLVAERKLRLSNPGEARQVDKEEEARQAKEYLKNLNKNRLPNTR